MKYLEEYDLKFGAYYHVETYNGEFAVLRYYGPSTGLDNHPWGLDQTWGHVRYVFKEVEDLEKQAEQFL